MGKSKDDGRKATNGNDVLVGTAKNDNISGKKGDDQISGVAGNDKLKGDQGNDLLDGGSGNDRLYGGQGDDRILGGSGNDVLYGDGGKGHGWGWDKFCWWTPKSDDDDYLDGGAGSDRIYAGRGDDVAVYSMAGNLGAGFRNICTHDEYDGGKGFDTLVLQLTYGEAALASVQKDIADFEAFLDRRADPRGEHGREFEFRSFNLDVANFEALRVELVNNGPTANADSGATDADHALVLAAPGLLANDTDPDHLDVLRVTGAGALSVLGASVAVAPNGALAYDPNASALLQALADGVVVTDSFTYTIADLGGASSTATVSIKVTGTNDAPVAAGDAATTDEDHAVSGNVLANDHDADTGDVISVASVNGSAADVGATITLASGAQLRVNADGSFSYDPAGNFETLAVGQHATESFTYVAKDQHGALSGNASVEVTVNGVNDAPIAADDSFVTDEDTVLALNLAGNDFDIDDGDTLTATPAVFDPRAAFQYLAAGESATTTFDYTVSDNHGASDTGTATITVSGVNDGPDAVDDIATPVAPDVVSRFGFESTDLGGYALPSFFFYPFGLGVDGTPMAYAPTFNNSEAGGADGALRRLDGQDFALRSLDVASYTQAHPVTIVGYNDGAQVAELTVGLNPVQASNGFSGYTSLTFDAAWSSLDEVRFYADDNLFDYTFIDNLRVSTPGQGNEDTPADFDVLANDTDPDASDMLHVGAFDATSAMGASITLNADGTLHYDAAAAGDVQKLAAGETATDTFAYTASDGHGGSDDAVVSVQLIGVNDLPVAVDDAAATDEDSFVDIGVTGNDTDPDASDVLHVASFDATSAMGASITLNADGTLRYDGSAAPGVQGLGADESATDSFDYTVSDGHGGFDSATVLVELTGVNDAPVAADDENLVLEAQGFEGQFDPANIAGYAYGSFGINAGFGTGNSTMAFAFTGDDTEADGADGAIARLDGQDFSLLSLDLASYVVAHPVTLAGYDDGVQVASLIVDLLPVRDTNGFSGYTHVTLGAGWESLDEVRLFADNVSDYVFVDNVLTATGERASEDEGLNLDVLGNDSDPDSNDVLEVSEFSEFSAMGAAISLNPNGTLRYDPRGAGDVQALAAGETATDTFTYTVSDGHGGFDSATVSVRLAGANDAPQAAGETYTLDEDGELTVAAAAGVLANDTDVDGDALSAVLADGPEHGALTLNDDGSFTYTPDPDFHGEDQFTYRAADAGLQSNLATVLLSVAAVNDAPVAKDDAYNVSPTGALNVSGPGVLANDSDAEGDALQAALASGPAHGVLTFNPDGSFAYTAEEGYAGQDSFTYVASDGQVASLAATVRLTITGENSPPDAVNDAAATNEDTVLSGNVITGLGGGADSDPDGDALTVTTTGQFSSTFGAVVTLNANGSFTYDPRGSATLQALNAGQSKVDTFTYDVSDGHGGTDSATVSLTVAGRSESSGGGGSGPIMPSVSPTQALTYFVKFEGNLDSAVKNKWLRLDSFSMESDGHIGADGFPVGQSTVEDVVLRLGTGGAVTALTRSMLESGSFGEINRMTIQAQGAATNGKATVFDSYVFEHVLVSGVKTDGSASATANEVSFAFNADDFKHEHFDSGGPTVVTTSVLGEGSAVAAALKYYARIETEDGSVHNQWLALDSFSVGISSPVESDPETGHQFRQGEVQAGAGQLLLGSSKAISALNETLLEHGGVKFIEVEAYTNGAKGQVLVDEFLFEDVYLAKLDSQGANVNQLSFSYREYNHGHQAIDSKTGAPGQDTGVGWDFDEGHILGFGPDADFDTKVLTKSNSPVDPLTYFVKFEGNLDSAVKNKWLRLDSFSMESDGHIGADGFPVGQSTVEDVVLRLGTGGAVTALTRSMLESGSFGEINRMTIQAQGAATNGKATVFDSYVFEHVLVSGVKTDGSASATANEVSFAFNADDFKHEHFDSGGPTVVTTSVLGEGSAVAAALKYYARIETEDGSVHNQWLALDSFSVGISSPVESDPETGHQFRQGEVQAGAGQLLLGSSKAISALNETLLEHGGVKFIEVEAYTNGAKGQVLVDEFLFEDVYLAKLDSQGANVNQLSFSYREYNHGHQAIDSKTGAPGQDTGVGWDFDEGHILGFGPDADFDTKVLTKSNSPVDPLTYFVKFEGNLDSAVKNKWLRLDSFSMESDGHIGADGFPVGQSTVEDVVLRLGTGGAVTALTRSMLESGSFGEINRMTIQAQGAATNGKATVFDSYVFEHVLVSGVKTDGSASATANEVSFAFNADDFKHEHFDSGGPTVVTTSVLGEGSAVAAALKYYARIETEDGSVHNQWLALDSFSVGISSPVESDPETGHQFRQGEVQAGAGQLLLGSSKAISALNETLLEHGGVKFIEVEAYTNGAKGQVLVDEFLFEDVYLAKLDSQGANVNQLSFSYREYNHGHQAIDSKTGAPGQDTGVGWDFDEGHILNFTPHPDIHF